MATDVLSGQPRPPLKHPELLPLPDGVASDRLIVRRYRPGDGALFFAAIASGRDELVRWMTWPGYHQEATDSESYAVRMHAEFALRRNMPMGIWERATGSFVGGSGFHAPDWNTPKVEIGYFLIESARGRGYATEAVRMLIAYAFEFMGMNRVAASCDAHNRASAAVLRRAGMREEACQRMERRDHHGSLRDTLWFALTVSGYPEWKARHAVAVTLIEGHAT